MHSFSLPCFQSPPSFIYPFFIVLFFRKRVAAARVWEKKGLYGLGYGREGERRGAIIVGGSVWLCEKSEGRRDIWVNWKVVFYVGNHEMWRASNEVDGSRIAFSIVIKSMKPWNCFSFLFFRFPFFGGGNVLSLLLHSSRGGRGRGHRIAKSTELKKEEGEEEEELVR